MWGLNPQTLDVRVGMEWVTFLEQCYYILDVFYLRSSNNFWMYLKSNRFRYGRCTHPPLLHLVKKRVDVNCCKSWSLCEADHIILITKNPFLPFTWSEKSFFTIFLFTKSNLEKEEWRVLPLHSGTGANLAILVHFIFDCFLPPSTIGTRREAILAT